MVENKKNEFLQRLYGTWVSSPTLEAIDAAREKVRGKNTKSAWIVDSFITAIKYGQNPDDAMKQMLLYFIESLDNYEGILIKRNEIEPPLILKTKTQTIKTRKGSRDETNHRSSLQR